ncbi:MAG: hypothetical protein AAF170_01170 [Bacteroidota bacterium]
MGDWTRLDQQMALWATRLCDNVKLSAEQSMALATAISTDIEALPSESKSRINRASPVPVQDRLEELQAFQMWMDLVNNTEGHPAVNRAQVVTQNYICFVYLKDALFDILRRQVPSGSATKRACKYLLNNPVRAFRNAVAHGNWRYSDDFSGIIYWARKGDKPDEPMSRFEVSQEELGFWQALARCVAYVGFSQVAQS